MSNSFADPASVDILVKACTNSKTIAHAESESKAQGNTVPGRLRSPRRGQAVPGRTCEPVQRGRK